MEALDLLIIMMFLTSQIPEVALQSTIGFSIACSSASHWVATCNAEHFLLVGTTSMCTHDLVTFCHSSAAVIESKCDDAAAVAAARSS